MKKFIAIFVFIISFQAKAQQNLTDYFTINLGYEYWNGNYGKVGTDLFLVQDNNNILTFSANANLGYMKDKFRVIPEVGAGYMFNFHNNTGDPYSSNFNSAFYVIRTEVSPWTITPKAGIAVLSIVELNAGYSFEFRENKNFKDMSGFRAGLTIHLPTQLF
ncbi:hypothetical protein N5D03_01910 [Empedobacter sp. GD03861]|uniref:hypothetical protein n=1 Tax=Empedobacter sp. GD03861 TaxID=2975390 RepID=UPI0024477C8D|nr:hypothetical protein [Empedobacter sp. GD03861]MDH0673294.1 hypothetical protein [Empedobacter sp. GD03861]